MEIGRIQDTRYKPVIHKLNTTAQLNISI